jgi:FkbH-like protein
LFEFDWGSKKIWSSEPIALQARESLLEKAVRSAMLLEWEEHCVECAVPHCYASCSLYAARRDGKCARLVYGIVRNRSFRGLLTCGADLRFRRWAKLEAALTGRFLSVKSIRFLDNIDRLLTPIVGGLANLISTISPQRRLKSMWIRCREKAIQRVGRRNAACDQFAIECYSFEREPWRMIVELRKQSVPVYRQSLRLQFGCNSFSMRIPLPAQAENWSDYKVMVYPDENREIRAVFTWLDFVVLSRKSVSATSSGSRGDAEATLAAPPAVKVKCVAWDLDNTLWEGTLIEDGRAKISLRREAVDLIRWLDERGIMQTIVSKNDHDQAMEALKQFGIDEYFLYPAINWGPKSANLRQIASRLNINLDTFALIDDSEFERSEVAAALPMMRLYRETALEGLKRLAEFDVPITAASALRRSSYLTEMKRERAQETFGADYLEFLRSCQLKLRTLAPAGESERARCLELIQRSNQLNLSSRRYAVEEFVDLLANPRMLNVAMQCEDRFGDYGIVGFASIDLGGQEPVVRDFVLSCRVAQKRVEHAFYAWLGGRMKERGARRLLVRLVRTERNTPLVRVFEEMPFRQIGADAAAALLALDLDSAPAADGVVTVDDSAMDMTAHDMTAGSR